MTRNVIVTVEPLSSESTSGGGSVGITREIITVSSNVTVAYEAQTDYVYICTNPITVTMPSIINNKNRYTIKNISSGLVSIIGIGVETIDKLTSFSLKPDCSVDLVHNDTGWWII